jgi:hypothetical protein
MTVFVQKMRLIVSFIITGFKAACLQIHANFHEKFENVLKGKNIRR